MASRVEYAVRCTPICAVAAGENMATETLAADVRQVLSGGGSVDVTWGTTLGYSAGVATPITVPGGGSITTLVDGSVASYKVVFIKNTGTGRLNISISYLGAPIGPAIAILDVGQAIVLPFYIGGLSSDVCITATPSGASGQATVMASA